jgi:phage terminase large subunit
MAKKYGEGSNIYRIRVMGEFPYSEEDQLIPIHLLEAAVNRDTAEGGDTLWGVDVARFGSDETVIAKRTGERITEIKSVRGYDTMQTAGWVASEIREAKEKPSIIFVDSIGIGSGVADRLRELGFNVYDVQVSERAAESERFVNLRAELWFRFKEWLENGAGCIPDDEELIAQASGIKYSFHSSGKFVVERKEDMKKRGLPSPDRADAVILTFCEGGYFSADMI